MTCYPGSGAHVFSTYAIGTAVPPSTLALGRCDCGALTYEQAVDHVVAQRADATAETVADAAALRAVIAKAIDDLGTHTRVENYDNGDECDDCCDDWPCRYARVADDLRKAIEP